jgi:hypothetical protein
VIGALTGGLATIAGTTAIAIAWPAFTRYRRRVEGADQEPGQAPQGDQAAQASATAHA